MALFRKSDKVTLGLVMGRDVAGKIAQLQAREGLNDVAEVLRKSLTLYDAISIEMTRGAKCYLKYPDGSTRRVHINHRR